MEGYADAGELIGLTPRLPEEDFKLTVGGRVKLVRIRGLSRTEALKLQEDVDEGTATLEQHMIAASLVRPKMTAAQVAAWQDNAPAGEIEPLTDRIQELSGVDEDAAKEAYRRFATDPAEEFRVLPGDAAGEKQG